MKKTLAAVAILGAFAGSAMADVTVYGRVDLGLMVNHNAWTSGTQADIDSDALSMESGNFSASRIGFKGSEKIGDDLTVGFVYETGLAADNGTAAKEFNNRESQLYVKGNFGTLALGYMGTILSDAGSYGFASAAMNPIGTGAVDFQGTGLFARATSRWSNMVLYQTPVFGGAQVSLQYGTGNDAENESGDDRYYAAGVNYKNGALQLVAVAEYLNEKSYLGAADGVKEQDDMMSISVGGNYDFGVAKVYAGAQYFKNADNPAGAMDMLNDGLKAFTGYAATHTCDDAKGYGLTMAVSAPVMGGEFTFGGTYVDGEGTVLGPRVSQGLAANGALKHDFTAWNLGAYYTYSLSKQTYVYAIGGYTESEAKSADGVGGYESASFGFGLVHSF